LKLENLGELLRSWRGSMGVRAAAGELSISPTTYSKIEKHGHIPDQATLQKICSKIGTEAVKFTALGGLQVAFKKDRTLSPTTAGSFANLIQLAEKQFKEKLSRLPEH
jgi:transcriptional regulator with XRE-family HTH domain